MTDKHNLDDSVLNPFPIKELGDLIRPFIVPPGKKISLAKDYDPDYKADHLKKSNAKGKLKEGIEALATYQDLLYAQNSYAVLIIFQAMDAAGKDSTIKHVMSGVNPQGCQVHSFKAPSTEELNHDYLWRCFKALRRKEDFVSWNRTRSTRSGRTTPEQLSRKWWSAEEINNFEKYLVNTDILFLSIWQKEPGTDDRPELGSFPPSLFVYHTSTTWAPWYSGEVQ